MGGYLNKMNSVVITLIVIFGTEGFLHLWINLLRNRFEFILTRKDLIPKLNEKALKKYIINSYDSELGWVRKPNTSKKDSFTKNKSYSINSLGSRTNPNNDSKKEEIITVGDSYCFCREVDDNETWQSYLGDLRKSNVLNFGVGNYGMDQSLLRFKREVKNFPNTKYSVMAVVPETIQRNLTVWKHYSEYGNTFGFKPRFKMENGKLILIQNPMKNSEDFFNIKKVIPFVNINDYFYKDFKKQLLNFPYIINLILKKKLKMIILSSGVFISEKLGINWRKISFLKTNKVKSNLEGRIAKKKKLFNDKNSEAITLGIIREFSKFSKQNNIIPILMIMPQEDDLKYFLKKKKIYYEKFLKNAKEILPTLNFMKTFSDINNPLSVFYQKKYSKNYTVTSGHYSDYGNSIVAKDLNKLINSLKDDSANKPKRRRK